MLYIKEDLLGQILIAVMTHYKKGRNCYLELKEEVN